ncbi:Nn.00g113360.m01.CDS01 [Neocucurbitaria sp. VM-36]
MPLISLLLIGSLSQVVLSDGHNPMSAPVAGETVEAEKEYIISWSPGTPGPVDIKLAYGESSPVYIAEETPNTGTYGWTPSGVYDGKDNYFMIICDKTIVDCTYTFNGRFAIASSDNATSSLVAVSSSSLRTTSSSTSFPTSSLPSTSSRRNIIESPTTLTTPVPSPSAPRSGLSSSARIAIGIVFGLVGGVLISLGILYIFRIRKRRLRNANQTSRLASSDNAIIKAELPGEGNERKIAELPGEMPS